MSTVGGAEPGRWERAYMWPFLEARRFSAAVRRYWKRILVGAGIGWVLSVVLGAVALVLLENAGVLSRSGSDTAGIAIVLGGTALGALCAYAIRPVDRAAAELLSPAGTHQPRARAAPRRRRTDGEPPGRRRSRAASR